MRILIAHNFYQQPGGEDQCFKAESAMLEAHGHEIHQYTLHNDDIPNISKVKVATDTLWNRDVYKELRAIFSSKKYDIAHFHNTFPRISPAAYSAAKHAHIPVIQTLHNFRLVCANGLFFRDNQICEDCLGKSIPYPAIQHTCYRDSKVQSSVVTAMLSFHNMRNTWNTKVDKYLVLSEFARQKFVQAGLPEDRLVVKSNFLQTDPGIGKHDGNYAVFVGRLTVEKGVLRMLEAWKSLPDVPLKIVGGGPLLQQAKDFVETHNLTHIEVMGAQPRKDTLEIMKNAFCLVFPSTWYEGMPMTIIEAFATQLPVVTSAVGTVSTIVNDNVNGLHFSISNIVEFAEKIRMLFSDKTLTQRLGEGARKEYENNYTSEQNYEQMMGIYNDVINGENES